MAITSYNVLEAKNATDLATLVTAAIAAGWQPVGIAFNRLSKDYPYTEPFLCQTVIKGIPDSTLQDNIAALNVTAGTGAVSKAVVLGADGGVTIPGEMALDGNTLAIEAGVGITGGTGTVYRSSVVKVGGIITSSILIDLTGLKSKTDDLDVIGKSTGGAAHLGKITAARSGTILGGSMTCLEVPAGGVNDIILYSATVDTAVYDDGIAALDEVVIADSGGAWTLGLVKPITGIPRANDYLYLTCGAAGTEANYTAGKFLIKLEGYDA
jgi:hypothetical protein